MLGYIHGALKVTTLHFLGLLFGADSLVCILIPLTPILRNRTLSGDTT